MTIVVALERGAPESLERFFDDVRAFAGEHARSRARLAITREAAWLAERDGRAFLVLVIEGDDPEQVTALLAASSLRYDHWYCTQLREFVDVGQLALTQLGQPLFEWKAD